MSFDPAPFLKPRHTYFGIDSSDLRVIAATRIRGILLYGQTREFRERTSFSQSISSGHSSVIGIRTFPDVSHFVHKSNTQDELVPPDTMDLAGVIANRPDIVFRLEIRAISHEAPDPRSAESRVMAKFHAWEDEAIDNPWWPSSVKEPTAVTEREVFFGDQVRSARFYGLGDVSVSGRIAFDVDGTERDCVVGFRGEAPSSLTIKAFQDWDVEAADSLRLVLPG